MERCPYGCWFKIVTVYSFTAQVHWPRQHKYLKSALQGACCMAYSYQLFGRTRLFQSFLISWLSQDYMSDWGQNVCLFAVSKEVVCKQWHSVLLGYVDPIWGEKKTKGAKKVLCTDELKSQAGMLYFSLFFDLYSLNTGTSESLKKTGRKCCSLFHKSLSNAGFTAVPVIQYSKDLVSL